MITGTSAAKWCHCKSCLTLQSFFAMVIKQIIWLLSQCNFPQFALVTSWESYKWQSRDLRMLQPLSIHAGCQAPDFDFVTIGVLQLVISHFYVVVTLNHFKQMTVCWGLPILQSEYAVMVDVMLSDYSSVIIHIESLHFL